MINIARDRINLNCSCFEIYGMRHHAHLTHAHEFYSFKQFGPVYFERHAIQLIYPCTNTHSLARTHTRI